MAFLLDPRDPDAWPHQFVKNGSGYELGPDEYGIMQFAQTYICIHCLQEYVNGFQEPPPQPCQARSTNKEMKRILTK